MIKYIIYTQNNCEYCDKAKKRLDKEKAHVEERLLDTTEKIKRFKKAGYNTVPQIFVSGIVEDTQIYVGDYTMFKESLNKEKG